MTSLRDRMAQLDRVDARLSDPEVEKRLKRYMRVNRQELAAFRRLVKEHPGDAVKVLMHQKMVWVEKLQNVTARLVPVVKQWTAEIPGLHELITERIQKIKVLPRQMAYVHEGIKAKREYDILTTLPKINPNKWGPSL